MTYPTGYEYLDVRGEEASHISTSNQGYVEIKKERSQSQAYGTKLCRCMSDIPYFMYYTLDNPKPARKIYTISM